jgi:hypothetical protein
MALASSTSFVLQGVNTSFAVYSTSGVIQAGWPKTAQGVFGVPNEPGCDPTHGNQPFLSDPRAFYDPVDNRFWAAVLQVEGAFGINSCPFLTKYWIAVSATNNPTGAWHVYSFDMSLGTLNAADYTQFGFHQTSMCFGGNMFNQPGTLYEYDEIFCALKAPMESGGSVSAFGFTKLSVSGHLVDTVQPVETETQGYGGPTAALFINSFNMNGDPAGHNCVSTACHGLEVWAIAKPGMSSDSLTGVFIDTLTYITPPLADQPGCTKCIETIDTRITGTPPLHGGLITWSLDTGLSNGSQVVPMILWGQVLPTLNDAGALTGGSLLQQGDFGFTGDGAAYFGALMPDVDGDLFMVFEHSSSSLNPEVDYTARRVNFSLGMFHDLGLVLQSGLARTSNTRWGDYEATSYDGSGPNHVWIAGEFSGSGGDWATEIGRLQYTAGSN